jgi:hypothetical protein
MDNGGKVLLAAGTDPAKGWAAPGYIKLQEQEAL